MDHHLNIHVVLDTRSPEKALKNASRLLNKKKIDGTNDM